MIQVIYHTNTKLYVNVTYIFHCVIYTLDEVVYKCFVSNNYLQINFMKLFFYKYILKYYYFIKYKSKNIYFKKNILFN